MRTIITYKATETAPLYTQTYEGVCPNFVFDEDNVDLLDYEAGVVKQGIPLLSIESIVWDEDENTKKIPDPTIDQIVEDYILLRVRGKISVAQLRKNMLPVLVPMGITFEEVQLKAIEQYAGINDEDNG